jgi:hypothetical protein
MMKDPYAPGPLGETDPFATPSHAMPDCLFWYWQGCERGRLEAQYDFASVRESLLSEITRLSAYLGKESARVGSGPSFAELQRRRNGGQ